MNIHPIFVHFPIALLTLYSLMEILQFKKLRDNRIWQGVKVTFLLLGVISGLAALQTGELAQKSFRGSALVEIHSDLATATIWFFGIIAIVHATYLVNTQTTDLKNWFWNTRYIRNVWIMLTRITHTIMHLWGLFLILGIIGMVLITIVGALGGAIVYGPNIDPIVSLVYHLFF